MMPIIRPLPSQCTPPTEYEKERRLFAEMEVAFRARKRSGGIGRGLRRLLALARSRSGAGARDRGDGGQAASASGRIVSIRSRCNSPA